jgi:hypothetical protein
MGTDQDYTLDRGGSFIYARVFSPTEATSEPYHFGGLFALTPLAAISNSGYPPGAKENSFPLYSLPLEGGELKRG